MGLTVQANDGVMLPLDSLAQAFAYSGGFISTITVQYAGNTYVQTFTNDGTYITNISGWINSGFEPPDTVMVLEDGSTIMVLEDGVTQMITENLI